MIQSLSSVITTSDTVVAWSSKCINVTSFSGLIYNIALMLCSSTSRGIWLFLDREIQHFKKEYFPQLLPNIFSKDKCHIYNGRYMITLCGILYIVVSFFLLFTCNFFFNFFLWSGIKSVLYETMLKTVGLWLTAATTCYRFFLYTYKIGRLDIVY